MLRDYTQKSFSFLLNCVSIGLSSFIHKKQTRRALSNTLIKLFFSWVCHYQHIFLIAAGCVAPKPFKFAASALVGSAWIF